MLKEELLQERYHRTTKKSGEEFMRCLMTLSGTGWFTRNELRSGAYYITVNQEMCAPSVLLRSDEAPAYTIELLTFD